MNTLKVKSVKKNKNNKVYDVKVNEDAHYILENGIVSHNSGLKYAASTIVYLSKKKVKEGTDVIGNIIHCKLFKGRLTKENSMIDVLLNYKEGLHPYYGLVELGIKYGIFKKVSTRIELPNGTKLYEKSLYKDADKYFTDDIMKSLEIAAAKEFKYGNNESKNTEENENTEEGVQDSVA